MRNPGLDEAQVGNKFAERNINNLIYADDTTLMAESKECSNYCTIALISHSSKVMLKILQARLQQYMNCELPDVQAGF